MKYLLIIAAISILAAGSGDAQQPPDGVNADAKILADFTNSVNEYLKLHKKVNAAVHPQKPTASQSAIARHERQLAHGIREAREHARPGDIFSPEIAGVFRKLIGMATKGSNGTVRQTLRGADKVQMDLKVNRAYPVGLPLQSTPPTLLANLPILPKELDYGIVGTSLILRDVEANLILDFIPHAIPQ